MKPRSRWIPLALLLIVPAAARAQFSPVGLPRGLFRLELGGEFRNADSRFRDGITEDIARSFTTRPLGSEFFPSLTASESQLGQILGLSGYRLNVGRTTANGLLNIGTTSIGVSYGLTSKITLFANVPIVRTRMQLRLDFDSGGADAGFNPNDPVFGTGQGQIQTAAFFNEFTSALETLSANLAAGVYDANPAQWALAQQTKAKGTSWHNGLVTVFNDPDVPFVPTASSATGGALTDSLTALQATFDSLNVTGFTTLPALAASRLSETDFENLISNPAGPVRGFPLLDANLNLLGDIAAGLGWTVTDSWNRRGKRGGLRVALSGTMRFPTGARDRSDDFLDVGTGSGHFAAGLTATVDWGRGFLGSRLIAGYEYRFEGSEQRRISTLSQPIAFANRLANVQRRPGGLLDISVTPFLRIASTLSLVGGVRLRRQGADRVGYAAASDSLPGIDPSDLAVDSDWSITSFQAGLTYVSPSASDFSAGGFPVEASWTMEGPLAGSGGIVAKERVMRVQLRMYLRLFN